MFTVKAELNTWPRSSPVQLSPGAGMDGIGGRDLWLSPLFFPFSSLQLPNPLVQGRDWMAKPQLLGQVSVWGGEVMGNSTSQLLPFPAPICQADLGTLWPTP